MVQWGVNFDLEGPLAHAGQNQADDITILLKNRGSITQEEYDGLWKRFDSFDDEEHDREKFRRRERLITTAPGYNSEDPDIHRRRESFIASFGEPLVIPKWSTGTSPGVAQCYAAMKGLTDEDLYELSMRRLLLIKGVPQLLRWLQENGIEIYFSTTAYPAVALTLGKVFGVPSSRIYTLGFIPSPEKLRQFDEHPDVMAELKERSLLPRLAPFKTELEEWLPRYLKGVEELQQARKNNGHNAKRVEERYYIDLFEDFRWPDGLRDIMKGVFVDKTLLNGSQQKGEAAVNIIRSGRKLIGFGDSIVDDTFLLYIPALGGISFAIDCTNSNALYAASASTCMLDRRGLIPIISDVVEGKFDPVTTAQKIPQEYGARLFSAYELRRDYDGVKAVHSTVKKALRAKYDQLMAARGSLTTSLV